MSFLHYLKVEHSYEAFRKPRWCKAKKQLLWDIACQQMPRINRDKAQMLTDTVQSSGNLMLMY